MERVSSFTRTEACALACGAGRTVEQPPRSQWPRCVTPSATPGPSSGAGWSAGCGACPRALCAHVRQLAVWGRARVPPALQSRLSEPPLGPRSGACPHGSNHALPLGVSHRQTIRLVSEADSVFSPRGRTPVLWGLITRRDWPSTSPSKAQLPPMPRPAHPHPAPAPPAQRSQHRLQSSALPVTAATCRATGCFRPFFSLCCFKPSPEDVFFYFLKILFIHF